MYEYLRTHKTVTTIVECDTTYEHENTATAYAKNGNVVFRKYVILCRTKVSRTQLPFFLASLHYTLN